ncbi:16S rRNA (cytidine(1402)-2'-O)-methyltransferase [Collinsella sp. AGMB00827]|uniref:Ribosomal RNA small subunit methyltransferase I n=1 Tax=Collinsella ureilytica TaxID=2869515 RepID=A0ABS7MIS2_9ACTN|nr:16S rRNA (cytidine(1402)-2'-O)-methyltransferase [Collinsella urealyticum]MBY4797218.1 16S rRNA (cytidine(1402)-2'-O)-methyltransferase [Collinsella urealyticum]
MVKPGQTQAGILDDQPRSESLLKAQHISAGAHARLDAREGSSRGCLSVVGTPIGNLSDLSPRATASFQAAELICCEDTRVTGKLLALLKISRPLMRCDEHTIAEKTPALIQRMLAGAHIAFASDAGMPAISDPGQYLVNAALEADVKVEVIPGPSACVTALVASGIATDGFFFGGFLPRRPGARLRRLAELAAIPGALIFYESPHRLIASLEALAEGLPNRTCAVCRELTKVYEEVIRGSAEELVELFSARGEVKGEIALVVSPPTTEELAQRLSVSSGMVTSAHADAQELLAQEIEEALDAGESASATAKRLAQRYSIKKREVYDQIIAAQTARKAPL